MWYIKQNCVHSPCLESSFVMQHVRAGFFLFCFVYFPLPPLIWVSECFFLPFFILQHPLPFLSKLRSKLCCPAFLTSTFQTRLCATHSRIPVSAQPTIHTISQSASTIFRMSLLVSEKRKVLFQNYWLLFVA